MIDPEEAQAPTPPQTQPAIGYCNFAATTDPTGSDDDTQGYSANSMWYNLIYPYSLWICVSNLTGFAIWREISLAPTYLIDGGDYLTEGGDRLIL